MGDTKAKRLFVLGYPDAASAEAAVGELTELARDQYVRVEDWATISKGADGKLTVKENTGSDPGAQRGAVAGGIAMALVAIAGPIGLAGVAVGAGVGAVAGKLHDSGFKNKDLEEVGSLMQEGRTLLVVSIEPEFVTRFSEAINDVPELKAADRKMDFDVDGSSTHMLRDAIASYKASQSAS
jgi:uncharacterized membrane protein